MSERAEIFIEILPNGNALEIVAIHSETGREVRFMAPKNTSELDIKALASAKMNYVERKEDEQKTKPAPSSSRGGIIV